MLVLCSPPTLSTLKLDLTDGYVGASAMHFDIFKDKGNPGKYVIRVGTRPARTLPLSWRGMVAAAAPPHRRYPSPRPSLRYPALGAAGPRPAALP